MKQTVGIYARKRTVIPWEAREKMAENYESLIARIRYHIQKANFMGLKEHESTLLLNETADAIEELSMKLHGDEAAIAGMKREIERMVVSNADVVERKHGKWGEEWFDHKWKIVCSECGCFADRMTDFCPNCGADMREAESEDD